MDRTKLLRIELLELQDVPHLVLGREAREHLDLHHLLLLFLELDQLQERLLGVIRRRM